MSVLTHTTTPSSVFDDEVEELRDDVGTDYSGWWCVSTDAFPCPAPDCAFVAYYMTAAHLIVVWPRRDDRQLLTFANDARELGRNPRVVEYEPKMGPCIPWDVWDRIGRPVHGMLTRPSGKPFRKL